MPKSKGPPEREPDRGVRKVGPPTGRQGNRGKGRKAGVPNKLTMKAREAFQFAFDAAGGPEQLAAWARENYTEFAKLYARTIPMDVTSGGEKIAALQTIVIGGKTIAF